MLVTDLPTFLVPYRPFPFSFGLLLPTPQPLDLELSFTTTTPPCGLPHKFFRSDAGRVDLLPLGLVDQSTSPGGLSFTSLQLLS